MQALFVLLLLVIAFVGGLVLEPHASANWGLSPSLEQTRDSMGICGGTKQTVCGGSDDGGYVSPGVPDLVPAPDGEDPNAPVDPAAPAAPPAP